jgi:hypothetical protein
VTIGIAITGGVATAAPAAVAVASKPSGVIDSVLLRWRAQLRGCGQSAAAELYTLRDVDALLHVAMFEAINSIERRTARKTASAIAAALASSMADVRDPAARAGGAEAGRQAAAAVMQARIDSGANGVDPYWPEPAPGAFAYPATERGRLWAKMKPWVMTSPDELRPPPPPSLTSERSLRDIEEIQRVGARKAVERSRSRRTRRIPSTPAATACPLPPWLR